MLPKQSPQLARADAEPFRQRIDCFAIQRALCNECQGARNGIRGASPHAQIRRTFRATAKAREETRFLRRTGRWIEAHILALGSPRRADWAAISSGGVDADKDAAVKTRITRRNCAVARVVIKIHGNIVAPVPALIWPFSDVVVS